jgi:condensin complex subunit 1
MKSLKAETIDEILQMLVKSLQLFESEVKKVINDKISQDNRVTLLTTLKMLTFLTVEFITFVEKLQMSSNDANNVFTAGQKRKKGATGANSKRNAELNTSVNDISTSASWNDLKEKVLEVISKIVILNIQKLWDPPIAEEQFVIMITNLCYKIMENCQTNSGQQRQHKKVIKDHICHILGVMIKKFNHSYGACVMIVQTLPHYEHFSGLYADLIETCVKELGYESILPDLLREFRHTNLNSAGGNTNKENPNIKYYSQFLIDLSDRLAPQLLPYLSLIQDLLDDESYLMRNAIIYLYAEIVIKVLNEETTNTGDLKLKQMRNELLDTICEHIHDVNAFTRSKTLQVLRNICEKKAMPLHYMNEVMRKCISRMEDVASSVRKSAFQLLCDMIRLNPYGIKNTIELSIDEVVQQRTIEENTLNDLIKKSEEKEEEEEEEETDHNNTTVIETTKEVEDQTRKDKENQLIIVQKSKVNFLKDMHSFLKQLDAAIPKLCRLLFSKTQTDVLEVNFKLTKVKI